jgi:hypothetical protein
MRAILTTLELSRQQRKLHGNGRMRRRHPQNRFPKLPSMKLVTPQMSLVSRTRVSNPRVYLLVGTSLLFMQCTESSNKDLKAAAPIQSVSLDATQAPLAPPNALSVSVPPSIVSSTAEPTTSQEADASASASPDAVSTPEHISPGCKSLTERLGPGGTAVNCYPYRCRAGACLTKCRTSDDCIPSSRGPAEFAAGKGWPILCGGDAPPPPGKTSECLPLSPEQVHGHH